MRSRFSLWYAWVVLVIAAVVLGACAPSAATPMTVEVTRIVAGTPEVVLITPTPEPVTLTFQSFSVTESEALGELIAEFEETHPNIKIKIDTVTTESPWQRVVMATRAGNPPDVWESYNTYEAATAGFAQPLDDFIAQEGGEAYSNQFAPTAWGMGTFKESQYAIPWRTGAIVMFINDACLQKADLEPPPDTWTWDVFLDYATAMTDAQAGQYGYGISGSTTASYTDWEAIAWMITNGAKQIDVERAVFNSPEGVEALQFVVDLMNKHKVMPAGVTSMDVVDLLNLLGQDKLCMVMDGPWFKGFLQGTYPDTKFHMQTLPIKKQLGSVSGGTTLIMHPASMHKAEAWEFIRWMTSEEADRKWAIGTSSIPANVNAMDDPMFTDDPLMAVAIRAVTSPTTLTYNLYPEMNNQNQILRNYLQEVYLGQMTPKDAMDKAAAEWNVIQEKYFPAE